MTIGDLNAAVADIKGADDRDLTDVYDEIAPEVVMITALNALLPEPTGRITARNAGTRLRPSIGRIGLPLNSDGYFAPPTSAQVAMMSIRCPGCVRSSPRAAVTALQKSDLLVTLGAPFLGVRPGFPDDRVLLASDVAGNADRGRRGTHHLGSARRQQEQCDGAAVGFRRSRKAAGSD